MKKKTAPAWLLKIDRGYTKGMKLLSYIGGGAVMLVMLISIVDVLLAKFFHSALPSATEWVTYLNIVIVFCPFAYVQLVRGHTKVDLLDGKIPHWLSKGIRVFSHILAVGVMGFLTWRGWVVLLQKIASGESSSVDVFAKMAFKIWPFALIFTVGCALGTLAFLWSIVREFTGLSIFEPQEDEAEGGTAQ